MFRRCISILVLVGFLAGQLAAAPHAHGGYSAQQQREHDAKPHVHVGHGGHTHPHHSHSATPKSHSPKTDATPSSGPVQLAGDCSFDHERDAVYLATGAISAAGIKEQGSDIGELSVDPVANVASLLAPACRDVPPFHPPDREAFVAKLFLTLRTLRI